MPARHVYTENEWGSLLSACRVLAQPPPTVQNPLIMMMSSSGWSTCRGGDHEVEGAEVGHGGVGAEVAQQLRGHRRVGRRGEGLRGAQVQSLHR